jgi:sugar/nucleoside kinase (ribokinase family)
MAKAETVRLKPSIWGIGLTALDLVLDTETNQIQMTAGGTCGNVMTILSHLGWNAKPIGRLGSDAAGALVVADMQRWGVNIDHLRLAPTVGTPVIVERIRRDASGIPFHTFGFNCPGCGAHLPRFQPVRSRSISHLLEEPEVPEVLFVDRVSRSALLLAEALSPKGTIIFLEPSGIRNPTHFAEMLKMAHIVKYSHDRLADLGELTWGSQMFLEIQTLGRGGLRFRSSRSASGRPWRSMQALPVARLRDTAGCGDWLTSGLIDSLCRKGIRGLDHHGISRLMDALAFGQGLAAWNCGFACPRGGMYAMSRSDLWRTIRGIASGNQVPCSIEPGPPSEILTASARICDSCKPVVSGGRARVS